MSDSLLSQYKLTRPDTFSIQYSDAMKEYNDWLNNKQQIVPRKSHKWHQNITDYFNYGFNEHTLNIYIHKITQLTEKYRDKRNFYAHKCCTSTGTIFDAAQEIKKMCKDVYPFDLGGLYIPVDDKVIDFGFKFQVENLYEQYNNQSSNQKQNQINQSVCTGESLLYQSKFIHDIYYKQVRYIKEIYKQDLKENKRGLYHFDSAIKIFPIQKEDSLQINIANSVLQKFVKQTNMTLETQRYDKLERERSRTPKKKKTKKH